VFPAESPAKGVLASFGQPHNSRNVGRFPDLFGILLGILWLRLFISG
jgi:hypothetical protein